MSRLKKIRYFFEYLILRGFISLSLVLGRSSFLKLGRATGRLLWKFGFEKKVVMKNLDIVFGDSKSDIEKSEIARQSYQNTLMFLFDIIFLQKMRADEVKEIISINDDEGWKDFQRHEGQARFILCYHYSNLNSPSFLSVFINDLFGYTGKQRNPYVEKEITRLRECFGFTSIPKEENKLKSTKKMMSLLKQNKTIMMLGDVNSKTGDLFTPFFGVKASLPKGVPLIPYVSKSRIYTLVCRCTSDYNYRMSLAPLEYDLDSGKEAAMAEIGIKYNKVLEQAILEDPTQYLWCMKRWRTRPPEEGDLNFYG